MATDNLLAETAVVASESVCVAKARCWVLLEDVKRGFLSIASDAKGWTCIGDDEVLLSYRMGELHIYY